MSAIPPTPILKRLMQLKGSLDDKTAEAHEKGGRILAALGNAEGDSWKDALDLLVYIDYLHHSVKALVAIAEDKGIVVDEALK